MDWLNLLDKILAKPQKGRGLASSSLGISRRVLA